MARKSKSKLPRAAPPAVPPAEPVATTGPAPASPPAAKPQLHKLSELEDQVAAAIRAKAYGKLVEIGSLSPDIVTDAGDKDVELWLHLVKIHGLAGDPDLADYQRFTAANKPALIAAFDAFVAAGGKLHLRAELEWYLELHGYGPKAAAKRLPWLRKLHEVQPGELFHLQRLRNALLILIESDDWADEVQLPHSELERLGDLDAMMREALEATAETPDLTEKDRLALRVLTVDFDLRRAEPWDAQQALTRLSKLPAPAVDAVPDHAALTPEAWGFLWELQNKAEAVYLLERYAPNMGSPAANAVRQILVSLMAAPELEKQGPLLCDGLRRLHEFRAHRNFSLGRAVCLQGETGPIVIEPGYNSLKVPTVADCLELLVERAPEEYTCQRALLIAWKIWKVVETYGELEPDDAFAVGLEHDPALIWLCANVPGFGLHAANAMPEGPARAIVGLRCIRDWLITGTGPESEDDQVYLDEFKVNANDVKAILQLLDEIGEHREVMSESVHRVWLGVIEHVFHALSQKLPKATEQLVLERARRFREDLLEAGEAFRLGYLEQDVGDRVESTRYYLLALQDEDRGTTAIEGNLEILLKAVDDEGEADELVDLIAGADLPASREPIRKQLLTVAGAQLAELGKKSQFERTAVNRWPSITPPARKLLGVLAAVNKFSSFEELGQYASMEVDWVGRHYKKLLETGMIFVNQGTFRVNPNILPLIERENQHAVIGRIVRGTGTSAVKQVFNSNREFSIYQILVQLCPNHLVFPNCGLQSFMAFDRMKELIDEGDFSYYLKASVDILVVSSTTFLPMLAIEVDSVWHDTEKQTARDERKDRLFAAAGVPFLRLRPVGNPSENVIRSQVGEHVDELVRVLRTDLPGYAQAKQLLEDLSVAAAPALLEHSSNRSGGQ